MKIKKEYTFTNNRPIWRVIPTDTGKLVIEDRNTETKEAFFSCINIESGEHILRNYQLEEKFWIGIEVIYKDIIFFYKYARPDMPQHKGLIAFDINKQKILWENTDYSFLFMNEGQIYCYTQQFEGRHYFVLDYLSGDIIMDMGNNSDRINLIKNETQKNNEFEGYKFPEIYYHEENLLPVTKILHDLKTEKVIVGQLDYIEYEKIVLAGTFEPNDSGTLNNIFRAIDIVSGKVIFEEVLNKQARTPIPESFFMKNNFIFLLKEKTKLLVCAVNK
ncbi:MAG: DUF4905 domain-containing protein [Ignavibacteriaceae bacterium]